MNSIDYKSVLAHGLDAMGLVLAPSQQQNLLLLAELVHKWNRTFNLTAVKTIEQMIPLHLFDSLTLVKALTECESRNVLDVGTGAGLPGLPLAIALPQVHFVLLDSNAKKTRFIVQAVSELSLDNVEVVTARAEDYRPQQRVDTVISRAVGKAAQLVKMSAHACQQNAYFLIMKGAYPTEELECIPDEVIVRSVKRVNVPGLEAERHIICMQRAVGA